MKARLSTQIRGGDKCAGAEGWRLGAADTGGGDVEIYHQTRWERSRDLQLAGIAGGAAQGFACEQRFEDAGNLDLVDVAPEAAVQAVAEVHVGVRRAISAKFIRRVHFVAVEHC